MSTLLYLVRHGQSVGNVQKVVQVNDENDISNGLSDKGVQQAQSLAIEFAQVAFDVCYHSPLQRTKETAKHIVASRPITTIPNPKLLEKNNGNIKGLTHKALLDAYVNWHTMTEDERLDIKVYPNEESQRELRVRTLEAIDEIANLNRGKTILIVTHGGFMRSLYIYLDNKTYRDLYAFDNCGYMLLEYQDKPKLVSTYKLAIKDRKDFE